MILYRGDAADLHPDVFRKTAPHRILCYPSPPSRHRLAFCKARWIEKSGSWWNLFPVHSRAPGNRQFFHFPAAIRGRGCLRHSTFGFHILSAMPARSPGAIVGDFANPIERPFFHSLRRPFLFSSSSSPLRATARCFHPFRLPAFRFLSSTTRFFSIDITPSRLPIAGTEKFRATQQFVRFFYWLLSYFRHSKPLSYPLFLSRPLPSGAVSLFRPCPNLRHSLYSSPRRRTAKDNGSTSASRIL